MAYSNPDAPTSIATGYSTTTFAYDNSGNVVQKTVDGTTTTYVWDYANRLIALGVGGATTTYGYDWAGNRVLQTGTSTTTIYPFKWYSIASSTGTGAKFSTSTEYVFNGDTLVSTIDQQMASGVATGSPKTLYIHPDHLGSTNVVTDASGTVAQTLDFYPYGATRISDGTGANEKRKFIGQFGDDSGLSYLQNRYYDPSRGQFLTEDPIFWNQKQNLRDPQSLNSYSYAEDNPITSKDPDGLTKSDSSNGGTVAGLIQQVIALIQQEIDIISGGGSSPQSSSAAGGSGASGGVGKAASNVANAVQSHPYISAGVALIGIGGVAILTGGLGAIASPVALEVGGTATALCEKYCPETEGAVQETKGVAAKVGKSFFDGVTENSAEGKYIDSFHNFPSSVAAFEDDGYVTTSTNVDGSVYQQLNIPGSYPSGNEVWYDGTFQIGKIGNEINHWAFIPNE
jgi:RHS repeat-associated protein